MDLEPINLTSYYDAKLDQASEDYDNNNIGNARDHALELVCSPEAPRVVRVHANWILSYCTLNLEQAEMFLDEAMVIVNEMIAIDDDEVVQAYRAKTEEMLEEIKDAVAEMGTSAEQAHPEQESTGVAAPGQVRTPPPQMMRAGQTEGLQGFAGLLSPDPTPHAQRIVLFPGASPSIPDPSDSHPATANTPQSIIDDGSSTRREIRVDDPDAPGEWARKSTEHGKEVEEEDVGEAAMDTSEDEPDPESLGGQEEA